MFRPHLSACSHCWPSMMPRRAFCMFALSILSCACIFILSVPRFRHHSPVAKADREYDTHWIQSCLPNLTVTAVECSALFRNDARERQKAALFQVTHPKVAATPETYIRWTCNCSNFIRERCYVTRPVNAEEAEFPLAYSMLLFKDVEQFERLLRAIYRPQNVYCIHVDRKSPTAFFEGVQSIAGCFPNAFVLDTRIDVQWGRMSVLEPELACMKELLRRSKKWKYFINLTGQEFPLKTNWELVRILKAYNGSNNVEGTIKRRNVDRFRDQLPAPVNATITKGSVHVVAIRGFVDYAINNETARKFLEWLNRTYVPDETFFSSLNHSPQLHVPGAYRGTPETDGDKDRFLTRFVNWGTFHCKGKYVRSVCIFAVGDLPLLANRPELFVNKFYLDYEPLALDCMEELHYRKLHDQLLAGEYAQFDTSLYSRQDFVWNHV